MTANPIQIRIISATLVFSMIFLCRSTGYCDESQTVVRDTNHAVPKVSVLKNRGQIADIIRIIDALRGYPIWGGANELELEILSLDREQKMTFIARVASKLLLRFDEAYVTRPSPAASMKLLPVKFGSSISGMSPESIKDPKHRKEFERRLKIHKKELLEWDLQFRIRRAISLAEGQLLVEWQTGDTEPNFADLEKILSAEIKDIANRSKVIKDIKSLHKEYKVVDGRLAKREQEEVNDENK